MQTNANIHFYNPKTLPAQDILDRYINNFFSKEKREEVKKIKQSLCQKYFKQDIIFIPRHVSRHDQYFEFISDMIMRTQSFLNQNPEEVFSGIMQLYSEFKITTNQQNRKFFNLKEDQFAVHILTKKSLVKNIIKNNLNLYENFLDIFIDSKREKIVNNDDIKDVFIELKEKYMKEYKINIEQVESLNQKITNLLDIRYKI